MLSQKIMEMRNKAHEANAANRIIDMLDKLRKSNNNLSKRRWIWELIQNAKDAVNSTNKINISIIFNEAKRFVEFRHNGKLFTTENLVFLIEQVSSKDRNSDGDKEKGTIGKFGTGFLTTHLLSEKVKVSGLLQDVGEKPRKFSIELDRTGREKQAIIEAIKASCTQLDNSLEVNDIIMVDENAYNTCFTYDLDANGIDVAKQGLENLKIAAPYVLAFVPEINCITLNNGQISYQRGTEPGIGLEGAYVLEVIQREDGLKNIRYICVSKDSNIAVAVEIGHTNKIPFVCPYNALLPKLFCDFPLVGTEDFSFPVIINSSQFNPNEPRNGIWLNDTDEDEETQENKSLIQKAVILYKSLLKYLNDRNFDCIYNVASIKNPASKDWLSTEWLRENILGELKPFISHEEIIVTYSGEKKSLNDIWDDANVYLMNDSNKSIRESVWKLTCCILPNCVTKGNEIESWYNSLWKECHNFGLRNLIEQIENCYTIQGLEEKLCCPTNVFHWLNQLYVILFNNKASYSELFTGNARIFPNQNCQFCNMNELLISFEIGETYKVLAQEIGIDVNNWLAHDEIKQALVGSVKKYTLVELFSEMENRYDELQYEDEDFCLHFLFLRTNKRYLSKEHEELFGFIKTFYPDNAYETYDIISFSKKLLSNSLRCWRKKLLRDISICGNLKDFSDRFTFENETEVLNLFVSYLGKYGYDNYLNCTDAPILPNQNGIFVLKDALFIDADDIDDLFKDICKHINDDIRHRLLHKDIFMELPDGRTIGLSNIADKITKFVEDNSNKHGEENQLIKKDIIRLFNWLRDNSNHGLVKKHFSKMKKNIHWFYNDDDIASNMDKAEKLDSLLTRYGITDTNDLEEIIKKSQKAEDTGEVSAVEITEEVLVEYGILTEAGLIKALESGIFGANFIHESGKYGDYFAYVQGILERSRENVIKYLNGHSDYDLSEILEIAPTIFVIKKHGQEIYLIIRPSDYQQIIIYYESEFDILDYEKDWELWVEDGITEPEKMTFGKILKLTGMNKIPLKKVW